MLWLQIRLYSTRTFPEAKLHLIPKSGTYPKGFLAGGVYSGVKKQYNDIAVVFSPEHKCNAAAVFTKNKFCAAPVQISKQILKTTNGSDVFGVVINSGCANACTGEQGIKDATEMSKYLSSKPSIVMSTGVIGQKLQMHKISLGLDFARKNAGSQHSDWMQAAEGIMTTDTFPKLMSREFKTKVGTYRMAGWSKGAGMIHPNMATMLSATFTDAKIAPELLKQAVSYAADRSFNAISIDGDTSTNDTFAVFANGASSMESIKRDSPEFEEFQSNLTLFATELAKLIVRDGEGATKFVEVRVTVLIA
jgi:glutamate N-acetyltransferase / amino-acid N-acetyltransferase